MGNDIGKEEIKLSSEESKILAALKKLGVKNYDDDDYSYQDNSDKNEAEAEDKASDEKEMNDAKKAAGTKTAKSEDTKKAKEIAKYKKLYEEVSKKWTELGLKQWKISMEVEQKYQEFSKKWSTPLKGKDAKKWMKDMEAAQKKLQL